MSQAIFKQEGCCFDYTPGSAVTGGDVVVINGHVFVAKRDIAANALGALCNEGAFDFVKDSSNISTNFSALYWDADGDPVGGTAGSGAVTTTSSGNTFLGFSLETAGAGVGTVRGLLLQVPATLTIVSDLQSAITDPGASGAIPVTRSGYVDIVTAGAETRTLAAPTVKGQQLLISLKTDGGDCVITCATTVNQAGNNTITLNDAGDAILLVAKTNGSNIRWSVVSNDGAALSTV